MGRLTPRFAGWSTASLLALAFAALVPSAAHGAWQDYSTREGLNSNTVLIVHADSFGNLWVVTDQPGASRFDGVNWRSFRAADGLPSDTITAIVSGSGGTLWFGTPNGASRYDGTSWGPILTPNVLQTTDVLAVMEDHLGQLWIGTTTGAAFYDGTHWTAITKAHGLLNYEVASIVEDRRGSYWFGSRYDDGVSRFDGNSITTYGPYIGGNSLRGRYMAADNSGNMWFNTGLYVFRFDGANWRQFDVNDGLANALNGGPIFADRAGLVWAAQAGYAVSRFDGQHWRNLSTLNPQARDGLPAGNVYSVTQDTDGNLWFGTQTDGLVRFDGSSWRTYTLWAGGGAQCYDCGLKDHLGNLWFASMGKIHKFDGFGWQTFPDPTAMSYNPVYCGLEMQSGKLWFGTFLGVLQMDPATNTVSSTGSFDGRAVLALEQDVSGTTWVSVYTNSLASSGVYRSTSAGGWELFNTANTGGALPWNIVEQIVEDRTGNHWFVNAGALTKFSTSVGASVTVDASANVGQYGSLVMDAQNQPVIAYYNSTSSDLKIASRAGGMWLVDTVATTGAVGQYESLKLDTQGNPHVSYYDIGNGDLIYASRAGGVWTTEVVDATGFVGFYTSLALDAQGNPRISYFDFTNKVLKFASKSGGTWTTEIVDPGPNAGTAGSLALDAQGNPHISYIDVTRAAVKHASKSGGVWSIEVVDGTSAPTTSTSLALDSQGNPRIAYYVNSGADLRYSSRSGGLWTTQTVDAAGSVGQYASLALDRQGHPCIAYYDATNGALKYATNPGTGWNLSIVDASGPLGQYASLAMDTAGVAHIAYYDQTNLSLKYVERSEGGWSLVRMSTLGKPEAVSAIGMDHLGRMLFGSQQSISIYDGASWQELVPDGGNFGTLNDNVFEYVLKIFEDSKQNLWVGTATRGAMRFNGSEWGAYTGADGLQSSEVRGILEDPSGALWFEGLSAIAGLDPDQRPPRPVVTVGPPALSANRSPTVAYGAAYGETYGLQYSLSYNGGAWTPWSTTTLWSASGLPDGQYTLGVRARDKIGNVSGSPAVATFEIDATPPAVALTFPAAHQIVKDSVEIAGAADDARFRDYRVELRPSGASTWTLLRQSNTPVASGALAGWNTKLVADGNYDLRLTVADTVGLSSSTGITVTVDNVFPSADVTVPVMIREAEGGDVYTSAGDTHLYFPPHAFAQDAMVSVVPTAPDSVPALLGPGVLKVIDGWEVSWAAPLLKPARLDVGLSSFSGDLKSLALYFRDGASWSRTGGTLDPAARRLALAVTRPGRYAIFGGTPSATGEKTLGALAFTPRVFSPSGTFANRSVGISFALGSPAPVTVRVYSLSGRLIREVASGQSMNAGQNIVQWDGRDHDGGVVTDGMYLVSVQALGQIQKKPLAVVR